MWEAAQLGYATATDLADWLVREKSIPFREAHHITGAVVKLAEQHSVPLEGLSIADVKSVDERIDNTVYRVLDPTASVAARDSYGGTSPAQVRKRIAEAREALGIGR